MDIYQAWFFGICFGIAVGTPIARSATRDLLRKFLAERLDDQGLIHLDTHRGDGSVDGFVALATQAPAKPFRVTLVFVLLGVTGLGIRAGMLAMKLFGG